MEAVPRLRGVYERVDAEETSSGDHDDLQDVTDHTLGGSSGGSGPSRPLARQTISLTPRYVLHFCCESHFFNCTYNSENGKSGE